MTKFKPKYKCQTCGKWINKVNNKKYCDTKCYQKKRMLETLEAKT